MNPDIAKEYIEDLSKENHALKSKIRDYVKRYGLIESPHGENDDFTESGYDDLRVDDPKLKHAAINAPANDDPSREL